MGICKCKKRSEDFCFNHKKFICDSCVVADHSICYIKSYVSWLTDCEFEDSVCGVCKGKFDVDDNDDSVRLLCYHLYHPECIDVYVAALPQNSSVESYPCPKCPEPILPSNDKQSLLANSIRDRFSVSSWAGDYLKSFKKQNSNSNNNNNDNNNPKSNGITNGINGTHINNATSPEFYTNLDSIKSNGIHHHHHHSNNSNNNNIINPSLLEETPPLSHLNSNPYGLASRKHEHEDTVIQLNSGTNSNISNNIHGNNKIYDDDYDKYNKRPVNPISKIINNIKETKPKYLIMITVAIIVFLILISKMGSNSDSNDNIVGDNNNNNNNININNDNNGGNGAINEETLNDQKIPNNGQ
ncbi:hypothetical protein DDB_G0276489 [Dictyostelium discoideum AX4]|uniref:Zinc finger protein-like 1 homolog n=1 Tax=Dictyostelium discoideum TaxID=44689 RepID=ZFPL1_DICDI|nr:hypothetical protein DDB_G0276489 [Dictyostelium discoideum AX4]Q551M4.1 RecName: Full=Zinc finger protein-like 1 homolog [Dictyostelium discoideum]EAL69198.1 hypothetical protein DDB_G0276489 [Dictyostelium discoideum AX4]|eukprot:XP_643106.1 hypothetical protein DDB_G0276489 [Dictyostelium discoideum AX4]